MLLDEVVYQDGKYFAYFDKESRIFNIVKEKEMFGVIVGYADSIEKVKESIKWKQKLDESERIKK